MGGGLVVEVLKYTHCWSAIVARILRLEAEGERSASSNSFRCNVHLHSGVGCCSRVTFGFRNESRHDRGSCTFQNLAASWNGSDHFQFASNEVLLLQRF